MRARGFRRMANAVAVAGGLAVSVGVLGVALWSGAAGAGWDGVPSAPCGSPGPTVSESSAPSSEPTTTEAPSATTQTTPTSGSSEPPGEASDPPSTEPPGESPSSSPPCESSTAPVPGSPTTTETTETSSPPTTSTSTEPTGSTEPTEPPESTESTEPSASADEPPSAGPGVRSSGSTGGAAAEQRSGAGSDTSPGSARQGSARRHHVPQQAPGDLPAPPEPLTHTPPPELPDPLGTGWPDRGEVPGFDGLPGDLPQVDVPEQASPIPDLGLAGPDDPGAHRADSPGQAHALPPKKPQPRAPELIAVGLLAVMVGVLARMLAPRPGGKR